MQSLLLGKIGFRDPQDPFTETSLRAQHRGGVVKSRAVRWWPCCLTLSKLLLQLWALLASFHNRSSQDA